MKREPKVGDVISFEGLNGQYVVEDTWWGGGGTGHGRNDVYPNGLHVTARKLRDKDLSYNPKGRILKFSTSGSFCDKIGLSQIFLDGKMKCVLNFVWGK